MKKILSNVMTLIIFLFLSQLTGQETLRIEYEMKYFNPLPEGSNTDADFKLANNTFNDFIYEYELYITNEKSLWKRIPHLREEGYVIIGENNYFFSPPDDRTYLTDFDNHTIIYPQYKGKEAIRDSITLVNWQIQRKEMEFMGYKVYKAIIPDEKGAEIYALYTPEINTQSGPWRTNGLPGLILYYKETYSDGFSMEFSAVKIEKYEKKVDFDFFKDYEILTIEEYKKKQEERKEKYGDYTDTGVDTSD